MHLTKKAKPMVVYINPFYDDLTAPSGFSYLKEVATTHHWLPPIPYSLLTTDFLLPSTSFMTELSASYFLLPTSCLLTTHPPLLAPYHWLPLTTRPPSFPTCHWLPTIQYSPTTTSHFLLPTSHFPLPTSYLPLPASYFLLTTYPFLLPTSYFLLPTSYFLLLTSYFLLPTSHFLLPTSHFLLPTSPKQVCTSL